MMGNYWNYGYGGPGTFIGGAVMIIFWIIVIWAIVSFIRWIARGDSGMPYSSERHMRMGSGTKRSSAMSILEERYAKGDISREEFEERKRDLHM